MKCAWYERQLANEGAELWRNGRPSAALLDHARGCKHCDRLIEHELKLKLMFAELNEKTLVAEPSAAVKHNLLAELGTMRPQGTARFGWLPRFAIAAAGIACLALAIVLVRRATEPRRMTLRRVQAAPVVKAPVVEKAGPAEAPVVASVKNHSSKATKKSKDALQPWETANDFYPTVMCDSITCAGPAVTVRVELPRSPLSARRSGSAPVMADLLVGEDGLVRGVRLLQ